MRNAVFCVCPPGMVTPMQGMQFSSLSPHQMRRARGLRILSQEHLNVWRPGHYVSRQRTVCQQATAHGASPGALCAGGTQDSTRVWRAIIYGCVPVTYFRAVELPFMRRLGIDYGRFSINIQPDDYDTTQARARAVQSPHCRLCPCPMCTLH